VTTIDFEAHRFTAPAGRRKELLAAITDLAPQDRPLRILDIGCGTGGQLRDVAEAFPLAICVGVDISAHNVETARADKAGRDGRVQFHAGDYLTFDDQPFDLIFADSVLQNIPVPTTALASKIAADLAPSGLLVASIPYDCGYNRSLWAVRRGLRPLRGPALEALAVRVAGVVHPDWSAEMILERLPYLFLLPDRFDGPAMRDLFQRAGLDVVETRPVRHASVAQPRHRLVVFRRRPS
jgi:trans-aconitate 2-methyltransferase